MIKKNRNMILVILIIVAIFWFMQSEQTKKEASADVSSAIITRSFSTSTVKTGTTFTNTYTASGFGAGSWGVLIEDDISGGCTPSDINTGFLSPATSSVITMTAPGSAGTCTFGSPVGTYIFAGSTDKTIEGSTTVTICQDECTAGQTGCVSGSIRWDCNTAGVCNTQVNYNCETYEDCSAGVCIADCIGTLKPDALSSIVAWAVSPTSGNKNLALTSIMLWASNC